MSAQSVFFLTIDEVLDLHGIAIADQGGDSAILSRGLLEAAMAMPQQQFGRSYLHDGIPAMAAAYMPSTYAKTILSQTVTSERHSPQWWRS